MSTYLVRTKAHSGKALLRDEPLGTGGEGSVFPVKSHNVDDLHEAQELVAKVFHKSNDKERGQKIIAMLKNPPKDLSGIAWPLAVIFDEQKQFAGYVMDKLDYSTSRPWLEFANRKNRVSSAPTFGFRHALVACKNLLAAIESIHEAGHRVGDINESNIFVNADATVVIVDADSMWVDGGSRVFRCKVGKPEYTAPELSNSSFKDQERTVESDVFAAAVAIFQMLTGGCHPTDAIFEDDEDPPSTVEKIRQGIYPSLGVNHDLFSKLERVPDLPTTISEALLKCLRVNPNKRGDLAIVENAIDKVLASGKQCRKVKQHFQTGRTCEWCQRVKEGKLDPWSGEESSQASLPAIKFAEKKKEKVEGPRRAPAVKAGEVIEAPPAKESKKAKKKREQEEVKLKKAHAPVGDSPKNRNLIELPERPRLYAGKTIVFNGQGDPIQRGSLSLLFKHNRKLAWYCLNSETPDIVKWFRPEWRKPSNVAALAISLLFTIAGVFALHYYLPMFLGMVTFIAERSWDAHISLGIVISASLFGGLNFLLNAIQTWKLKKDYGFENPFATVLRGILMPIIYGPLLLVAIILGIAFGAINLLTSSNKN